MQHFAELLFHFGKGAWTEQRFGGCPACRDAVDKAPGSPLPASRLPSHLLHTALVRCHSPDLHCSRSLNPGWHPGDLWQQCSLQHHCRLPESPSSSCWPHFRCGAVIRAGWKKRILNQSRDDLYLQLHKDVSLNTSFWQTISQKLSTRVHIWGCESIIVHICMCRYKRTTQKYIFIIHRTTQIYIFIILIVSLLFLHWP